MQVSKLLTGFVCVLLCSAAQAEFDADELGKLFTDKNQRAQLDAARSGAPGTEMKTEKVKVNGYVTRSDGKSVVWVNGQSTLESSKIGNLRVYQPSVQKDKKVAVSIDGESRRLKPGETWNKSTGKIVDSQ